MRFNYHTHTERCFHARGEDEAFVLAAIEAGYDEIGFADHSPWPFKDYISTMRMAESDLESYVKSVKSLREKYKDKISVKLGLECEYFKEYLPWLKSAVQKYEIDYVILGHHFCTNEPGSKYNGNLFLPEDVEKYADEVCEAMETGIFSYVCHPDLFMRGYPFWDSCCEKVAEKIIRTAEKTNTPLEYNLLGFSHSKNDGKAGYPYPDFWSLAAKSDIRAIIGVDAHTPSAYADRQLFLEAKSKLDDLGIKAVESIRFFR